MSDQESVTVEAALERELIGACLLDVNARHADRLLVTVPPSTFFHGRNRTVWEVMRALREEGATLTLAALIERLESRQLLADCGGVPAVMAYDDVSVGVMPDRTAETLLGRARSRRQLQLVERLAAQLRDGTVDAEEAISATFEAMAGGDSSNGGLRFASEYEEAVNKYLNDGPETGIESGWSDIDKLFRPVLGELAVITGTPSAGKSTWLDALLVRYAQRHGHRVAFFTPERQISDHVARLMAGYTGKDPTLLDAAERKEALAWVNDHFVWIDDDSRSSIPSILGGARLAHSRKQIQHLVIDPWARVESERPKDATMTQYVGECLSRLVRFGRRAEIMTFLVAHPTKLPQDDKRRYKVPTPYDIAESAHFFNLPDWCLAVWRDHVAPTEGEPGYTTERDPHIVATHVQKVRPDYRGRIGLAELRFKPATRQYHPLYTGGGHL